jgi:putative transposase
LEKPLIVDKFKNKYRIASARAAWWDYGWAGAYFITICTADRLHYFGEITNKKMQLSNVGVLADVFWHEIPHHAKNVELGAFVVMPNHIHGILILNGADNNNNDKPTVVGVGVETRHALSLPLQRFQNQGKNTVSSIMGSYKSAVTKHANRLGMVFGWQSRFHDHIIHNDAEFQRINDYIETNPDNWETDKFFKSEN